MNCSRSPAGLIRLSALVKLIFGVVAIARTAAADTLPVVEVEGQPLSANVQRLVQAMDYLGAPLSRDTLVKLQEAAKRRDAAGVQVTIDPLVLAMIEINPEYRVKAVRGPAKAILQQSGYTPVLFKVVNRSASEARLRISSPQAGPPYAGAAIGSMLRQRQTHLRENENTARADRFLNVSIFESPPMTAQLSGLEVEYVIGLIYSSEAGKREATLTFDIGQGTQDLGFRAETPILFDVRPAIVVKLEVKDHDGTPTTARLLISDERGHVFPPQARRLAPDFFFQKHIYRANGESVLLPVGAFTLESSRGPEYRTQRQQVTIEADRKKPLTVQLQRWIDPAERGYYSGDHHIHSAGCAHYTSPLEGMLPEHMFAQVKGEGLNVGCVLLWGYGFEQQRPFFCEHVHPISEPLTLLRYDVEISGFGSAALGHVCLLNLRDLVYPGAEGVKGWPTWSTPALRWTKKQGGYTGYPHSASGMAFNPTTAARRLISLLDADKSARITPEEAANALLPEPFETIDSDKDGGINEPELLASHDRAADRLPNVGIPDQGGHEIFVTVAHGVCDFISAMDTERLAEWNLWYHLMNCGFPLKVAGETDFPCMSGVRVGQGRTYVQLGKTDKLDFAKWCAGLAQGRSYVSDGYAHAYDFTVDGQPAGAEVRLAKPGKVKVQTKVAFSAETPLEVAYGGAVPAAGLRLTGDTRMLHDVTAAKPYLDGKRTVELVVNGKAVGRRTVAADDKLHEIEFTADIDRSSWVAVRQFPQLHSNPVNVIVADQPIRASRQSALWCAACIDQLWIVREKNIAPAEREDAKRSFEAANAIYQQIAAESPPGS